MSTKQTKNETSKKKLVVKRVRGVAARTKVRAGDIKFNYGGGSTWA